MVISFLTEINLSDKIVLVTLFTERKGATTVINYIKKRDGNKVEFKKEKITEAVLKAAKAVEMEDKGIAEEVTAEVISYLKIFYKEDGTPSVEQVQDLVEKTLIEAGYSDIAKAYILYR